MVILKVVIGKSEMEMPINIFFLSPNGWLIRLVEIHLIPQPAEGLNEGVDEGIYEGVLEGLNSILVPLYLYINKNSGSRTKQFVAALKKPHKTIERWLKILKGNNFVEYKGNNRTGGYFIK